MSEYFSRKNSAGRKSTAQLLMEPKTKTQHQPVQKVKSKKKVIKLYVSDDYYNVLRGTAQKRDMTLSQFVLSLICLDKLMD